MWRKKYLKSGGSWRGSSLIFILHLINACILLHLFCICVLLLTYIWPTYILKKHKLHKHSMVVFTWVLLVSVLCWCMVLGEYIQRPREASELLTTGNLPSIAGGDRYSGLSELNNEPQVTKTHILSILTPSVSAFSH